MPPSDTPAVIPDEVLREMAQTGGIFLSPQVPVKGREPVLLCDLASALLAARGALRYCLLVLDTGPKGASEIASDRRGAKAAALACLPPSPQGEGAPRA